MGQAHIPSQEYSQLDASVPHNPNISAYEAICGLYDWNQFPLTPPGTMKQALKSTKQIHWHLTFNNVPGTVPPITWTLPWHQLPPATKATPLRQSPWLGKTAQHIHDTRLPWRIPKVRFIPIAG